MKLWPRGDSWLRRGVLRARPTPDSVNNQHPVPDSADALARLLELRAESANLHTQVSDIVTEFLIRRVWTDAVESPELGAVAFAATRDVVHAGERVRDGFDRMARDVPHTPVVRIPSDLLHHAWTTLFPAERMAVVGGRRSGHIITFGATFDVTSDGPETTAAHVRADSDRLRVALLAFERTGLHLAGWLHSHPGVGPLATLPSAIDRAQHREWIRDYSSTLVSLILTADGFVRLWGTAVENPTVRVEIAGRGAIAVKNHENLFSLSD